MQGVPTVLAKSSGSGVQHAAQPAFCSPPGPNWPACCRPQVISDPFSEKINVIGERRQGKA